MTELLDLTPIVEALSGLCPLFENRVYQTIETNDAALEMFQTPCAMVYLANDASNDNQSISGVVQEHTNGIAVKIVVRKSKDINDLLNSSDSQQIRLCRQQVFSALLGLISASGMSQTLTPMQHQSGDLAEKQHYLIWTDTFITHDFLSNL